MRLPVTVADIYRWALHHVLRTYANVCVRMAIRGDIPFIRIVKAVPREMKDKLPPEFIGRLEPNVGRLLYHERIY